MANSNRRIPVRGQVPAILALAATAIVVAGAPAQFPRYFNFQAALEGYGNATVHLETSLWTLETGGSLKFYEDHGMVVLNDGMFSLMIGSTAGGVPDVALNLTEVWIELAVDSVILPRTRLVAVPYAVKSLLTEAMVIPGTFTAVVTLNAAGNATVNSKVEIGKSLNKGFVNVLQVDGDQGVALDGETSLGGGAITIRGQTDPSVEISGADPTGGGGSVLAMKYNGDSRIRIDANESTTTNAGAAMSMWNSQNMDTVYIDADQGDAGFLLLKQADGSGGVALDGESAAGCGQISVLNSVDNETVVIEGDAAGGTTSAQITLQQANGTDAVRLETHVGGGEISVLDQAGGDAVTMLATVTSATINVNDPDSAASAFISGSGNITLQNASSVDTIELTASDGRVKAKIIEITGADLAERFPTSEAVSPGMVVAIDTARPGQLCLARGAYNPRVAGVVSGANGLPAGAIMGNLPGHEEAPAIAMSGRVWVHCDASESPIRPGDRLTTSDTPGHAMSASDAVRTSGSVIGKAMTGLNKGERGLVLVLVDLQ